MTGIAKSADLKMRSMAGSMMYWLTKICSSLNEEEEGMIKVSRTLCCCSYSKPGNVEG